MPFLLVERAREECARSTRAVWPNGCMMLKGEPAYESRLVSIRIQEQNLPE